MTEHNRRHPTQDIGFRHTEIPTSRKGILWIKMKFSVSYCAECGYIERLLTTTHIHAASDEVFQND